MVFELSLNNKSFERNYNKRPFNGSEQGKAISSNDDHRLTISISELGFVLEKVVTQ